MTIVIVDDHRDWRDTIAEFIADLGLGGPILTAGSLAELDRLLLDVTRASWCWTPCCPTATR